MTHEAERSRPVLAKEESRLLRELERERGLDRKADGERYSTQAVQQAMKGHVDIVAWRARVDRELRKAALYWTPDCCGEPSMGPE